MRVTPWNPSGRATRAPSSSESSKGSSASARWRVRGERGRGRTLRTEEERVIRRNPHPESTSPSARRAPGEWRGGRAGRVVRGTERSGGARRASSEARTMENARSERGSERFLFRRFSLGNPTPERRSSDDAPAAALVSTARRRRSRSSPRVCRVTLRVLLRAIDHRVGGVVGWSTAPVEGVAPPVVPSALTRGRR